MACPNHNHALEENLVGHSIARRMTTGQASLIINAIATGAPPRAALALAREQELTDLPGLWVLQLELTALSGRKMLQLELKDSPGLRVLQLELMD